MTRLAKKISVVLLTLAFVFALVIGALGFSTVKAETPEPAPAITVETIKADLEDVTKGSWAYVATDDIVLDFGEYEGETLTGNGVVSQQYASGYAIRVTGESGDEKITIKNLTVNSKFGGLYIDGAIVTLENVKILVDEGSSPEVYALRAINESDVKLINCEIKSRNGVWTYDNSKVTFWGDKNYVEASEIALNKSQQGSEHPSGIFDIYGGIFKGDINTGIKPNVSGYKQVDNVMYGYFTCNINEKFLADGVTKEVTFNRNYVEAQLKLNGDAAKKTYYYPANFSVYEEDGVTPIAETESGYIFNTLEEAIKAGNSYNPGSGVNFGKYVVKANGIINTMGGVGDNKVQQVTNQFYFANPINIAHHMNGSITIDMNGRDFYMIKGFDVGLTYFKTNFTLTNSKKFTGTTNAEKNATLTVENWAVWAQNGAIVNLENVTIVANTQKGTTKYAVVVQGDNASFTTYLNVKGGTDITAYATGAISTIGNEDDKNAAIYIHSQSANGKPINIECKDETGAYKDAAIFLPSGALNITGEYSDGTTESTYKSLATIAGATGIYVKGGDLKITEDCIVKGNGTASAISHQGDGFTATGDALVIESCGYPDPITVNVTAGTFYSENAQAIASYVTNNKVVEDKIMNFIGATANTTTYFNNRPDYDLFKIEYASSLVNDKTIKTPTNTKYYYTVDSAVYKEVLNSTGDAIVGYKVYPTLQEAIDPTRKVGTVLTDAISDNDIIVIYRNLTYSNEINLDVDKTYAINFNGHSVKIDKSNRYLAAITGTVTLLNNDHDSLWDGEDNVGTTKSHDIPAENGDNLIGSLRFPADADITLTVGDDAGKVVIASIFNNPANIMRAGTLNIENAKIYAKDDTVKTLPILQLIDGDVTINGSDTAKDDTENVEIVGTILVYDKDGVGAPSLTINGGYFHNDLTSGISGGDKYYSALYVRNTGSTVVINGGWFESAKYKSISEDDGVSAVIDASKFVEAASYGDNSMTNFKSFAGVLGDPQNPTTDSVLLITPNDVPNAYVFYKEIVGDLWYDTIQRVVAMIGDQAYTSLQRAINAVKEGETIVVVDEIIQEKAMDGIPVLEMNRGLAYTINLNGYSIDLGAFDDDTYGYSPYFNVTKDTVTFTNVDATSGEAKSTGKIFKDVAIPSKDFNEGEEPKASIFYINGTTEAPAKVILDKSIIIEDNDAASEYYTVYVYTEVGYNGAANNGFGDSVLISEATISNVADDVLYTVVGTNGTLEFNGGKVSSYNHTAVLASSVKLTITGGEFVGGELALEVIDSADKKDETGNLDTEGKGHRDAIVSGGKFISTEKGKAPVTSANVYNFIKDGLFSADVEDNLFWADVNGIYYTNGRAISSVSYLVSTDASGNTTYAMPGRGRDYTNEFYVVLDADAYIDRTESGNKPMKVYNYVSLAKALNINESDLANDEYVVLYQDAGTQYGIKLLPATTDTPLEIEKTLALGANLKVNNNTNPDDDRDFTLVLNGNDLCGDISFYSGEINIINENTNGMGNPYETAGIISGNVGVYGDTTLNLKGNPIIEGTITVKGAGVYGEEGCLTPTLNVDEALIYNEEGIVLKTELEDTSKPVINLNNGSEFVSFGDVAIYIGSGKVTFEKVLVQGETAVYIAGGEVEFKDGMYIGAGDATDFESGSATGEAIVIEATEESVPVVSIIDGVYLSFDNRAIGSYGDEDIYPVNNFITGGYLVSKDFTETYNLAAEHLTKVEYVARLLKDYNTYEMEGEITDPDDIDLELSAYYFAGNKVSYFLNYEGENKGGWNILEIVPKESDFYNAADDTVMDGWSMSDYNGKELIGFNSTIIPNAETEENGYIYLEGITTHAKLLGGYIVVEEEIYVDGDYDHTEYYIANYTEAKEALEQNLIDFAEDLHNNRYYGEAKEDELLLKLVAAIEEIEKIGTTAEVSFEDKPEYILNKMVYAVQKGYENMYQVGTYQDDVYEEIQRQKQLAITKQEYVSKILAYVNIYTAQGYEISVDGYINDVNVALDTEEVLAVYDKLVKDVATLIKNVNDWQQAAVELAYKYAHDSEIGYDVAFEPEFLSAIKSAKTYNDIVFALETCRQEMEQYAQQRASFLNDKLEIEGKIAAFKDTYCSDYWDLWDEIQDLITTANAIDSNVDYIIDTAIPGVITTIGNVKQAIIDTVGGMTADFETLSDLIGFEEGKTLVATIKAQEALLESYINDLINAESTGAVAKIISKITTAENGVKAAITAAEGEIKSAITSQKDAIINQLNARCNTIDASIANIDSGFVADVLALQSDIADAKDFLNTVLTNSTEALASELDEDYQALSAEIVEAEDCVNNAYAKLDNTIKAYNADMVKDDYNKNTAIIWITSITLAAACAVIVLVIVFKKKI